MSGRLDCLQKDPLEVICRLLDGSDIIHLIMSGSMALRSKITDVAREINCELPGLSLFPFSLFQLPNLRHLKVHIGPNYMPHYPLRTLGALPLPLTPIEALETLDYRFAQAFSILDASVSLSQLFPNLSVLRINAGQNSLPLSRFKSLPATLRTFEYSPTESTGLMCLHSGDLGELPPGLEELIITSVSIYGEDWVSLRWPASLRLLHLSDLHDDRLLAHLPSALEDLMLGFDDLSDDIEFPVSQLPQTLKAVTIDSYSCDVIAFLDAPLPPLLEHWDVFTQWSSLKDNASYLPPSLKFVRGRPDFATNIPVFRLLPFRDLSFYMDNPDLVPYSDFPTTLDTLHLNVSKQEHIDAVPESITSLSLRSPLPMCPSYSSWCRLGAHLQRFTTYMSLFESASYLTAFEGGSLNDLGLNVDKECSYDFGAFLPTQLRSLQIISYSRKPNECFGTTVRQFSTRLTKLGKLYLAANWVDEESSAELLDYIPYIPRSVTELSLSVSSQTSVGIDQLRQLPPKLTSLSIGVRYGQKLILTPQHFAQLPPSLQSLNCLNIFGLGPDIWTILPPKLCSVLLSDQGPNFGEYRRFYGSSSHWEGYWRERM